MEAGVVGRSARGAVMDGRERSVHFRSRDDGDVGGAAAKPLRPGGYARSDADSPVDGERSRTLEPRAPSPGARAQDGVASGDVAGQAPGDRRIGSTLAVAASFARATVWRHITTGTKSRATGCDRP